MTSSGSSVSSSSSSQGPIITACCPGIAIPPVLNVLIQDAGATCPCADGQTFQLFFIGSNAWRGTATICGGTLTVQVQCSGTTWQFIALSATSDGTTPCVVSSQFDSSACSPFKITGDVFFNVTDCFCHGGAQVDLFLTVTF